MVPPMRFRLGGKSKGYRIKILLVFYKYRRCFSFKLLLRIGLDKAGLSQVAVVGGLPPNRRKFFQDEVRYRAWN